MNRRGFLGAILACGVAPAVVRASSLMPVFSRGQLSQYHDDSLIELIERRYKESADAMRGALESSIYSGYTGYDILNISGNGITIHPNGYKLADLGTVFIGRRDSLIEILEP